MKEADFQRQILQAFAHDREVKMFRRNVGAYKTEDGRFIRFAEKGQADLYGWIVEHRCPFCNKVQWGTHFEIEVKSEKGKPTPAQREWLMMVARNNGIAILVYPHPSDPVGLRDRIYKMLTGQKCPQCCERERL